MLVNMLVRVCISQALVVFELLLTCQPSLDMMLFARAGRDVKLPASAVCRDVLSTLKELEQVSNRERQW